MTASTAREGPYRHLAQPLRVGRLTLRNRVVMGSMHTGLEGVTDVAGHDRLARFYAERARGGAALIVTGGFGPNVAGRLAAEDLPFATERQAQLHQRITKAVHKEGAAIVLQVVHAGRYGYHDEIVAPSPIKSPINRNGPVELTQDGIHQTIADFVRCARLAREAGYDGVEVMGSEGYLITQFLAQRTNQRKDEWGGSLENRARFPLAVVREIRLALGQDFLIVFRHSVLDLVDGALENHETDWVAREVAAAGADIITSGIGWHEAKVPTIAGTVPHAAFADAIGRVKQAAGVPVAASNRINSPAVAERLLADGICDLVQLARPMLADAHFANKAFAGNADQINVCIACNQACLDHYFENKVISCLVNPRAGYEADYVRAPVPIAKRIAVVGAGMAGLATAIEAASRGHRVEVYEASGAIGGQMLLAAMVPGKADYADAVRAYGAQLAALGVPIHLHTRADAAALTSAGFDEIVIATGVKPRALDLPGSDDARVLSYDEALVGTAKVGQRVVVVGAGGIGHDVALTLAQADHAAHSEPAAFARRWGIGMQPKIAPPARQVTLVKRSQGPFGRTLGKTTGWIIRQELKDLGVQQIAGVAYDRIDAEGLHIVTDKGPACLAFDTLVVCAGQEAERSLADALAASGKPVHVIGGALLAAELDAKRAVAEGVKLGCTI